MLMVLQYSKKCDFLQIINIIKLYQKKSSYKGNNFDVHKIPISSLNFLANTNNHLSVAVVKCMPIQNLFWIYQKQPGYTSLK